MREDDDLWLWKVIDATGHLECGSWSYSSYTERLTCVCTARLWKTAMGRAT